MIPLSQSRREFIDSLILYKCEKFIQACSFLGYGGKWWIKVIMGEVKKPKNHDDLWKELCALPDHLIGEIINGDLVVSPRPSPKHTNASSALGGLLVGPFQFGREGGPGGCWILDEPQIHFSEEVIVPDLAGWKKNRLPKLPESTHFEQIPDWVCEILSPSTARYDRISKLRIYAENGVPHYWILDPVSQTLEVFTHDKKSYRLEAAFEGFNKVSAPPFEAIKLDLGELWGTP